jgi:outer membrane protein assembly factor BamB
MNVYKLIIHLVVIFLLSILFSGLVTVPAAAQSTSTTMQFRYNAQHTGDYGPVAGSTLSNVKPTWRFTTRGPVESSPAVVNGVVYVGSWDNNVYAIDATNGAQLWSFATGDPVYSSPAVVNVVVYVGSNDHNVYALNATNGAQLWKYTTASWVESSPAVVNGVVYVGGNDSNVYALNATTGVKKWSYTTGSAVFSSPAVVNGVVYVGSDDNNTYAIDATNGAKLWSFATGGFVDSSPAVSNGVVYVGSDDSNVYALNATNGAKLWSFAAGYLGVESSPAVVNGVVYVGSDNHYVYALNATNGAQLWSQPTDSGVYSSPAVVNGVVYVGSDDNNIYALNATNGGRLWSLATRDIVVSCPAVVNGVVYVGSDDSNVYAIGTPPSPGGALPGSNWIAIGVVAVALLGIVGMGYMRRSKRAATRHGPSVPSGGATKGVAGGAVKGTAGGAVTGTAGGVVTRATGAYEPQPPVARPSEQYGSAPSVEQYGLAYGLASAPSFPVELGSQYSDVGYLGEGGFARVFSALNLQRTPVAVKVLKTSDPKAGKLFATEAANWTVLRHENIVRLFDYNIFPVPYLESELCDGNVELEMLRGPVTVERSIEIVEEVARGLSYAHKLKILHGDIKPSNMLLKDNVVKVSDWGLSKLKTEQSVSIAGVTLQYAAPEELSRQFGRADERTDIYQLGVLFYQLVTGKLPFADEPTIVDAILQQVPVPPSQIRPVSPKLDSIILKCLRKRKEERYQSMDMLLTDLGGVSN